jgi:hypothetical protein
MNIDFVTIHFVLICVYYKAIGIRLKCIECKESPIEDMKVISLNSVISKFGHFIVSIWQKTYVGFISTLFLAKCFAHFRIEIVLCHLMRKSLEQSW